MYTCFKCGKEATPETAIQGTRSGAIVHIECLDPDLRAVYTRTKPPHKREQNDAA